MADLDRIEQRLDDFICYQQKTNDRVEQLLIKMDEKLDRQNEKMDTQIAEQQTKLSALAEKHGSDVLAAAQETSGLKERAVKLETRQKIIWGVIAAVGAGLFSLGCAFAFGS